MYIFFWHLLLNHCIPLTMDNTIEKKNQKMNNWHNNFQADNKLNVSKENVMSANQPNIPA